MNVNMDKLMVPKMLHVNFGESVVVAGLLNGVHHENAQHITWNDKEEHVLERCNRPSLDSLDQMRAPVVPAAAMAACCCCCCGCGCGCRYYCVNLLCS